MPKLVTIIIAGTVTAQGVYVRTNPDGTVTIRDGDKEYTGRKV